jgi:hypothetical protein
MATFKIKLEDKAAFESRLKAKNAALSTNQMKDFEDYFEVVITNPEQLEAVETILKQSPKINTIKEMANKLTKNQLEEMIRQELSGVLAEKKKMKGEDKKEKLDEVTTGAEIEALKMLGSNPTAAAVALVVTLVLGVLKGPEAIEKLKKMYNYLKAAVPTAAAMFKDAVAKKLGKDIETEA